MNRLPSRRGVLTRGAAAAALASCPSALRAAVDGAGGPRLSRGVNVHHLLSWPAITGNRSAPDYVWPPFADIWHVPNNEELRGMRALGFDFIRLTISPAILITADGERRTQLAAVIADRLGRARAAGVNVVLDLHPVAQDSRYTPEVLVDPKHPEAFDAYVGMVGWLAGALDAMSHRGVVFELFNEPPLANYYEAPRWQAMMERLHQVARRAAPSLPLVITGAVWSGLNGLVRINTAPFRSSNVYYTFHYYLPHLFTHQGVQSQYSRYVRGLDWPPPPGSKDTVLEKSNAAIFADPRLDADKKAKAETETAGYVNKYYQSDPKVEQIVADFAQLAKWAAQSGVSSERIFLGEFGAVRYDTMDAEQLKDRALWLSTVRTCAERQGYGWAYWTYLGVGGMSLADTTTHAVYRPDLKALGLGGAG